MVEYEWIFEALPEAGLYTDLHGQILKINAAFKVTFGYQPEEIIGRQPEFLFVDLTKRPVHWWTPTDPQTGDELPISSHKLRRKDGSTLVCQVLRSPIRDLDGRRVGILYIFRVDKEFESQEIEAPQSSWALSIFRSALSINDLIPLFLDPLIIALNAEGGAFGEFQLENGTIQFIYSTGEWVAWQGRDVSADEWIGSEALRTGKLSWSDDIHLLDDKFDKDPFGESRAIACLPLAWDDRPFGGLWIGRREPFAPDELQFLVAIGQFRPLLAGYALNYRTLSNIHGYIEAICANNQAIGVIGYDQGVLELLLDQVIQWMEVDAANIMLLDESMGRFQLSGDRGFKNAPSGPAEFSSGEGFIDQVVSTKEPVLHADLPNLQGIPPRVSWFIEEGFHHYYGLPLIHEEKVIGIIEMWGRDRILINHLKEGLLDILASQTILVMRRAETLNQVQRANKLLDRSYEATVVSWSRALDLRDRDADIHNHHNIELTLKLARAVGVTEEDLVHIQRGVQLHDIGIMGVPDEVLYKPGPLSEEEWEIMRMHPVYAYEMLSPLSFMQPALEIPYCHHERWDGSGYPRGLRGEQIPLSARIFSVIDVWGAMVSDRPYRRALSIEEAHRYIEDQSGTHFDPQVVKAFMSLSNSSEDDS